MIGDIRNSLEAVSAEPLSSGTVGPSFHLIASALCSQSTHPASKTPTTSFKNAPLFIRRDPCPTC